MKFFIHYNPADGELLGWGNGYEPTPIEGMAVAFVEPFDPDPMTQKYDGAAVIDKTADEQRSARRPTLIEVNQAIWIELDRTDHFVLPDYPIPDDERDAWKAYRKMLRDLSDLAGPVDMINAWDVPPDGADPVTALRERL